MIMNFPITIDIRRGLVTCTTWIIRQLPTKDIYRIRLIINSTRRTESKLSKVRLHLPSRIITIEWIVRLDIIHNNGMRRWQDVRRPRAERFVLILPTNGKDTVIEHDDALVTTLIVQWCNFSPLLRRKVIHLSLLERLAEFQRRLLAEPAHDEYGLHTIMVVVGSIGITAFGEHRCQIRNLFRVNVNGEECVASVVIDVIPPEDVDCAVTGEGCMVGKCVWRIKCVECGPGVGGGVVFENVCGDLVKVVVSEFECAAADDVEFAIDVGGGVAVSCGWHVS
mmetsp:Transcript_25280/g.31883  ORF Transcript_25280/g.31883 Transcript_25280/m.31883 type:complete len:280 (-) Transcript_25280:687-1526(-)